MQRVNPRIASVITAVVLGIPVLWVAHTRSQSSEEEAKERVDLIANQTALRLQDYLKSRLLSLGFMQQGMETGLIETEEDFQKQSRVIRKELSGMQALNWVDSNFQISWVSPWRGNEAAFGKSVLDSPGAAGTVLRAADISRPCMSPPLILFQGGIGFTTYFPVSRLEGGEQKIIGFINGVFRSKEVLDVALGSDLRNRFRVEINDWDAHVYASEPSLEESLRNHGSEVTRLEILDRQWDLTIYPTPITLEGLGHFHGQTFVMGGLGFVLALSACVFFFFARREEHYELMEQHAS